MTETESQQRLLICLSQLVLLKLLSTGKASKVFLAKDLVSNHYLALKVIPKERGTNVSVSNVIAEQAILRQLTEQDDSFCLPALATWHDSANFYLATQYLPGGDMAVELMKCRIFQEERARVYMAELVVVLERLHSQDIIHRDLKPSNILFDSTGHLVLADFGISRRFARQHVEMANQEPFIQAPASFKCSTQDCGTPLFMSPEQHRGDNYSFEVDYWAAGVILYRMLTGRMPFGNNVSRKRDIAKSVINDQLFLDDLPNISSSAKDFLNSLLAKDPRNRISLPDMKTHSFFRGIDWGAVNSRALVAPWTPFIPPIPSDSRTTITVNQGAPYPPWADPYPDFTWHSNYRMNVDEKIKQVKDKKSRTCCGPLFSCIFTRRQSSLKSSVASDDHLEQNDSQTYSSFDETLCASPLPPKSPYLDKLASLV